MLESVRADGGDVSRRGAAAPEFIRFGGKVTCSALPDRALHQPEERLNEIIALHEANGVFIANPHVYTLEDGTGTSARARTSSA